VVGILGGGAGTTYDAFKLIHDAQKYGARVALFGRKINNAEHQLAFVEMLRLITDGKITPEEAVRAYHGILQGKKIPPKLSLEKDLELTDQSMSYEGNSSRRTTVTMNPSGQQSSRDGSSGENQNSTPQGRSANGANVQWPKREDGTPDFEKMNSQQRGAYDLARLSRKFG